MLKKFNAIFRPNHPPKHRVAGEGRDKARACAVKLVRSTSMLIVGESRQKVGESVLKRSKSSVSIESTATAIYFYRQEDRMWLYSRTQDCLQYLEDLMALRRQYVNSVHNLQTAGKKAEEKQKDFPNASGTKRKKAPPPPPPKGRSENEQARTSNPTAITSEVDTLELLDSVIASYDSEQKNKIHIDNGHADVDFIVATSTSEHDLHSNWMLRAPRTISTDEFKVKTPGHKSWKKTGGMSIGSKKKLERNPIHLPKVAECGLQTLRIKSKTKDH
ncbi:uncharacterized protein C13orf42 [Polypterus senegalus]|uniref:uncharacterized protein C13orf42 n=1 Tax=Polypterus senegalus TaxID=55291 RepID=UPI001965428C|nr:uncharacterized protein C13orf42 [Polypterus senegalus]